MSTVLQTPDAYLTLRQMDINHRLASRERRGHSPRRQLDPNHHPRQLGRLRFRQLAWYLASYVRNGPCICGQCLRLQCSPLLAECNVRSPYSWVLRLHYPHLGQRAESFASASVERVSEHWWLEQLWNGSTCRPTVWHKSASWDRFRSSYVRRGI